jgi:curli biogenesis system outer membrane secretion channel CsgG
MGLHALALLPGLLLAAASGKCGGDVIVEPRPADPKVCSSVVPGTHAVLPFDNPNNFEVDLGGTEELLMGQMQSTGCFTLLERDKIKVLIAELNLCSDKNPDKDAFDCESFAERGKLLGVKSYVMGSLVIMQDDVRGVELSLDVKKIGSVEAKKTYDALGIAVRVVDVETGKVTATTTVHAAVRSRGGGFSVKKGPVKVAALARDTTAFGRALDDMFWHAACRLGGGEDC